MNTISQNHDVRSTKIYSDTLPLSLQEYYGFSETGLLKSLSVQLDDVAFTFEMACTVKSIHRNIISLGNCAYEMDRDLISL